jgi:competence protein ComEC
MSKPRLRPVFIGLILLTLGIALAPFVAVPLPWLYCLALLCVPLAFALRSKAGTGAVFLYAPLLLIGMARTEEAMIPRPLDVSRWQGKPSLWYQGVVDSDIQRGSRGQVRFTLAVRAVYDYARTQPATGLTVVSLERAPSPLPAPGDVLWLRGRIEEPAPASNPGGFDYREYLRRRGVFSLLRLKSPADVQRATGATELPLLRQWSLALRSHILRATARHLSPDDATLMNGLLLSAHLSTPNRMRVDLTEAFAGVGAVHLLSVSGFHLTVLALALTFVMRLLTAPRPIKNLLCIGALWVFVLAAGATAPAVRSAIMATLILAAPLVRRHAEPLHSLALAATLILLAQPGSLYDPGFQLSFLVTATLALWLPPLFRLPAFRHEPGMTLPQRAGWLAVSALLVGVVAEMGTAPLTAYYFNRFSLISPLANVLLSFLAEGLLIASLGASLLSFLPGMVLAPAWWIIGAGLWLLWFVAYSFAALPGAGLSAPSPPESVLFGYYLLLGGAAIFVRKRVLQKVFFPPVPLADRASAPAGVSPRAE